MALKDLKKTEPDDHHQERLYMPSFIGRCAGPADASLVCNINDLYAKQMFISESIKLQAPELRLFNLSLGATTSQTSFLDLNATSHA